MRKHNVNEINLKIEEVIPFCNTQASGVYFAWTSNIGYGEYVIRREHGSDKWVAKSEHMDSNDDKDFLRELLKQFADKIKVVE